MAARDGPIPRWSGSPPSAVCHRAASGDRRRSGPPSQAGSRRACRRRPRLRLRETRHGNQTTARPPDRPPSPNGTRHSAAQAAAAPSPRRIRDPRRGRARPRGCPSPPRPGRRQPCHARRLLPPDRPPPETAPEIASGGREKDDVWKGLRSSRPNLPPHEPSHSIVARHPPDRSHRPLAFPSVEITAAAARARRRRRRPAPGNGGHSAHSPATSR